MSFQATCCVCTEHGNSQQEVNSVLFMFFYFFLRAKSWVKARTSVGIKTPHAWSSCNSRWPDNQCLHYETRVLSGFISLLFWTKEMFLFHVCTGCFLPLIRWWSLAKSRALFELFITNNGKVCLRRTWLEKQGDNTVMRSTVMGLQMTSALASAAVGGSTAEGPPTQWTHARIYMYTYIYI